MTTNLVPKRNKGGNLISNLINILHYGTHNPEEKALEEFFANLNKAHQEMYDAENFFNNVVDPVLVDHAIYKMEAAKSKYVFMLKEAKEKNIKIDI
jgi:hypothetical protein